MKCLWDVRQAVVVWTTRRHLDIPLCSVCLDDWTLRAAKTPQTAAVLGYYGLTRVRKTLTPQKVSQEDA